MAVNMKGKDLISIADLTLEEIYEIFDVSKSLKEKRHRRTTSFTRRQNTWNDFYKKIYQNKSFF